MRAVRFETRRKPRGSTTTSNSHHTERADSIRSCLFGSKRIEGASRASFSERAGEKTPRRKKG
jgi:hypothetical protein